MSPKPAANTLRGKRAESFETLHWLYTVEQGLVIPIKWLALLLSLSLLFLDNKNLLEEPRAVVTLFVYILLNLLFTWIFWARKAKVSQVRAWSYLSLLADVAYVCLMVNFTGGIESNLSYLFIMPILRSAALLLNPFKKFAIDVVMTFFYLGCAFPLDRLNEAPILSQMLLRVLVIWGVILMSSFLAQALTSQQSRISRINERLRFQVAQNREALSGMTDALMVFNTSQQLIICNRAAEELIRAIMGVRTPIEPSPGEEELWNQHWQTPPKPFVSGEPPWEGSGGASSFWANLTPDLIATPIERLLEEVRFHPDEHIDGVSITLSEKQGRKHNFIASAAALQQGPAKLGWMALLRDISEYKSMEAQLLSAEKLAAVGKLAAGLAHELGNPLGIIKSCANYMKKKIGPDSDLSEEVNVLASEADRCEKILRQLLTFASRPQLKLAHVDLREVVQKAINLVDYQSPERIRIALECGLPKAECYIDENLITQALVNLLLNAVQSIENEGSVTAGLALDKETSCYLLRISDTGCGMGKETLSRLFDPFYTTKTGGTGLGLAITQRIIQRFGGSISVISEYGRGTEFTLTLPRTAEDQEARFS